MNKSGPGVSPHKIIPPSKIAVVGEPGMPSVSMGSILPVLAELFAHSGATTPAGTPEPNSFEFFYNCFVIPFDISDAGVAPAAGRIPTKNPKKEPMFIAIIVFFRAPNALPTSFILTDNFDI